LVGGYLDFELTFGMTKPLVSTWVGSSLLIGSPPTWTHVACTTQHQLSAIHLLQSGSQTYHYHCPPLLASFPLCFILVGYSDFELAFGMTVPHVSIWVGSSLLIGSPPTWTHVMHNPTLTLNYPSAPVQIANLSLSASTSLVFISTVLHFGWLEAIWILNSLLA
jgi:hypothetical protein